MTDDVGSKLKTLRKRMGISQRELAKRAGVTNGTISLIEQNRISPSVASLKRVLEGMSMSLADFFIEDNNQSSKTFFYQHNELIEMGGEGISYLLVGRSFSDRKMSLLYETYKPGSDSGKEMLQHEGEEGGVIIQGQLEVTVDEQTQVLQAGEGYYFASERSHRFRNIGDVDCVVVSANTPPSL